MDKADTTIRSNHTTPGNKQQHNNTVKENNFTNVNLAE